MNPKRVLLASVALSLLAACASTENSHPQALPGTLTGTGLVFFSVSHDFGPKSLVGDRNTGGNLDALFWIRSVSDPAKIFSSNSLPQGLGPFPSTPFEDAWGRYYVKALPSGKYEVYSWRFNAQTGTGYRTIEPRKPPTPLQFEVASGEVVYIGNLHARVRYGSMASVSEVRITTQDRQDRDLKLINRDYPNLPSKMVVRPLPKVDGWGSE